MVEVEAIGKLISNVGVPVAIVAVLLWLARTYVPKWIDSHAEFVDSVKKQNEKLCDTTERLTSNTERLVTNTEKLTESMLETKKGATHCKTTTDALLGLCTTAEHFAQSQPNALEIKASLEVVKSTLRAGNHT